MILHKYTLRIDAYKLLVATAFLNRKNKTYNTLRCQIVERKSFFSLVVFGRKTGQIDETSLLFRWTHFSSMYQHTIENIQYVSIGTLQKFFIQIFKLNAEIYYNMLVIL